MTAAFKQWTEEHQQQLKGARLQAGVSDVAFARDNAITLRHLQQLETGGSSAFYSESIKYDTGAKLLKRLGVEPHVPVAVAAAEVAAELPTAVPAPIQALAPAQPVSQPSASASGQTKSATRIPYIVLSLVGVGLIGAGISLIPSIHPPGASQGVVQTTETSPATESLSPDRNKEVHSGTVASLSTQEERARATPASGDPVAATSTAAPAQMLAPPSMVESCRSEGTPQTIVPSQPFKTADYVYVTAASDVSVCVRDAAGRVTRKALQAGQSVNIPGQQPFEVTADNLNQLRVFFQGQRIWFQAEATRLRLTAATASD
ncbi:MAG: hypothetical protein RJA69_1481 [Pseudomonadota bacterium]|jgi:hypothetical protein